VDKQLLEIPASSINIWIDPVTPIPPLAHHATRWSLRRRCPRNYLQSKFASRCPLVCRSHPGTS